MRILLRDHVNKGFTELSSLLQDVFDFDPFDNSASRTMFTSFVYPSRSLPISRSFSLCASLSFSRFRSKRTNQRSLEALLHPATRSHACQYRVDTLVRSTLILFTRLPSSLSAAVVAGPDSFRKMEPSSVLSNGLPRCIARLQNPFRFLFGEIDREIFLFNFMIFNFFICKVVHSFRRMDSSIDVFWQVKRLENPLKFLCKRQVNEFLHNIHNIHKINQIAVTNIFLYLKIAVINIFLYLKIDQ